MSSPKDDDAAPCFASPPCFMHELDEDYLGYVRPMDIDVKRWRDAERDKLIAARLALSQRQRTDFSWRIANHLSALIGDPSGLTIGVYWPVRGEPDLRFWMEEGDRQGGRFALPVVTRKTAPLAFRHWFPGTKFKRGDMNIPIPATGDALQPDIVIVPAVGFDAQCHRLGYGGGYYDRTLAILSTKPRIIGVGFTCAQIPTIYPQPHDVAMDLVVTESGVVRPALQRDSQ